jgi:glucoamylase
VKRIVMLALVAVLAPTAGLSAGSARGAGSVAHSTSKRFPAPHSDTQLLQTRTSGDKAGFGTAYTYDGKGWPKASRLWFTLLGGEVSEVYWPTFNDSAVNRLRFLISSSHTLISEDQGMRATVRLLDRHALAFRITESDRTGAHRLVKTVLTDPARDALVMQVHYFTRGAAAGDKLYLDLEPTLGNSSEGNTISVQGSRLVASNSSGAMTMATSARVRTGAVGYRTFNDPATQLQEKHHVSHLYTDARGHVAGVLELVPNSKPFVVVLAFGKGATQASATANASLRTPFSRLQQTYIAGWHRYVAHLSTLGGRATEEYYSSAMTIKASEDKTYEGAIVASPTHPFGQTNADDPTDHSYVRVWSRDLYHASMGLLAAGDRQTALEALHFMVRVRNKDGSMPQNSLVSGQESWTGTQMDEAADVILLAGKLGAQNFYRSTVAPIAQYIAHNGPVTSQERWEEAGGYSPASIAAEVAGLATAAAMAKRAGDTKAAATWLRTARAWTGKVDAWTYTTSGPLGRHRYYLRISDGQPNSSFPLQIANGGGSYDQRSIVDPSFLELVRLGVRSATDPHIRSTLPVVDKVTGGLTRDGPSWHRYNHDGYGDGPNPLAAGVGHLWPVLDGERGMYDVAAGNLAGARSLLGTMTKFAGPTGLIPEQVWEKTGAPTSSANPLIWAQGEYIVLLRSIVDRKPFDRPAVTVSH